MIRTRHALDVNLHRIRGSGTLVLFDELAILEEQDGGVASHALCLAEAALLGAVHLAGRSPSTRELQRLSLCEAGSSTLATRTPSVSLRRVASSLKAGAIFLQCPHHGA